MNSSDQTAEELAWAVRHFVYGQLARTGQPPLPVEAAKALNISEIEAEEAFRWLHQHHAFLLEDGTFKVRMANPFSGIATDFRVRTADQAYWANCAWDALGIPAALGAEAHIDAHCTYSGEPIALEVRNGQVPGGEGVVAHFAVPFARWYDDLIHT
jgi:Alkylmercury lyase